MANEREEGLAALQNGDFATAQTKLEAAVASDPRDAQAHLYLGGVYHQQGRHTDAARVLTTSTELLPMSGQAQYNLGIALEALGAHTQALDAYRKANALQDNYLLAQQGMERMQKAMQSAQPTGMYGTDPAPTGYEATTNTTAYAAPATQPYMQDQTQPVSPYPPQPYAAPPGQPGYAPPVQPGYAPTEVQPGYAQPAAYGQPQQYDLAGNPVSAPQAAYGQAAPGGYAPPPGPNGYQGQQWSPYPAQGQMAKEDRFDIAQAFKDWLQIVIAPKRFFAGEEGAAGYSAPLAMLLAYTLIVCLGAGIKLIITGTGIGLIGVVIILPFMYVGFLLCNLIWAGIVHGISRMFGGTGEYSGTFRASVYSWAGFALVSLLSNLIFGVTGPRPVQTGMAEPQVKVMRAQYSPPSSEQPSFSRPAYGSQTGFGSPTYNSSYKASNPFATSLSQMNPLQMLFSLAAMVWGAVLLGMGVAATQRISTGGAVGTVLISTIVGGLLFFGACVLIGIAFAGVIASAMPH